MVRKIFLFYGLCPPATRQRGEGGKRRYIRVIRLITSHNHLNHLITHTHTPPAPCRAAAACCLCDLPPFKLCLAATRSHVQNCLLPPSAFDGHRPHLSFSSLRPPFHSGRSLFSRLQPRNHRLQPQRTFARLRRTCWQAFSRSSRCRSYDHRQRWPSHAASLGWRKWRVCLQPLSTQQHRGCRCPSSSFRYSSDSDPVAVLVHSSGFALKEAKPDYASLVLVFAVLPPQEVYRPLKKNGLRSRDLQCFAGPSIRLECTCVLQTPATSLSAAKASPCGVIRMFNYNAVVSISNPVAQSKQAQSRPSQPQPDAMLTTSLSKEVAYKYSLTAIADGGPHPSDWFASVMKGGGVLFIESEQQRWCLSAAAGGAVPLAVDVFNCIQPQNFDSPTQLLHPSVAWQRLQWSHTGLQIGGTTSGNSVFVTLQFACWVGCGMLPFCDCRKVVCRINPLLQSCTSSGSTGRQPCSRLLEFGVCRFSLVCTSLSEYFHSATSAMPQDSCIGVLYYSVEYL